MFSHQVLKYQVVIGFERINGMLKPLESCCRAQKQFQNGAATGTGVVENGGIKFLSMFPPIDPPPAPSRESGLEIIPNIYCGPAGPSPNPQALAQAAQITQQDTDMALMAFGKN